MGLSHLGDSHERKPSCVAVHSLNKIQAYKALMEVHLTYCNRNAAQWLEQDLDQTQTLHRTGRMEKFNRSTRCIGLAYAEVKSATQSSTALVSADRSPCPDRLATFGNGIEHA